jgi:2-polyprenyl-3-methyl-5-hydroxy-6-metoxy-1,4-benzoquinol methylase
MSVSAQRYQYPVDPAALNTAAANIIRFTGADKAVLELGAGPGSITRPLVELNRNRLTALEYDADSVQILKGFCDLALRADLNDNSWPALLQDKRFDVIVAADVLEHLYDPWATLKLATTLLNEGGSVVVSLPHAAHAVIMGCLMANDFQYRGLGLLDRTHIRFFGMRNVQALFEEAGLKIAEYAFVLRPPEETEFAEIWAALPATTRAILETGDFAHVYQVVVRAVVAAHAPELAGHHLPSCADHRTSSSAKPLVAAPRLGLGHWGMRTVKRVYRAAIKPS